MAAGAAGSASAAPSKSRATSGAARRGAVQRAQAFVRRKTDEQTWLPASVIVDLLLVIERQQRTLRALRTQLKERS